MTDAPNTTQPRATAGNTDAWARADRRNIRRYLRRRAASYTPRQSVPTRWWPRAIDAVPRSRRWVRARARDSDGPQTLRRMHGRPRQMRPPCAAAAAPVSIGAVGHDAERCRRHRHRLGIYWSMTLAMARVAIAILTAAVLAAVAVVHSKSDQSDCSALWPRATRAAMAMATTCRIARGRRSAAATATRAPPMRPMPLSTLTLARA